MSVPRSGAISLVEVELRAALSGSRGRLSVQDQLDWGEMLLSAGDPASARVLLQSAFVQQGFSPQLEGSRRVLLDKAGLEGPDVARAEQRQPGGNTVELAIGELRGFAHAFGGSIAAGLSRRPARTEGVSGLHPTAVLRRAAPAPSQRTIGELVEALFLWLRAPVPGPADQEGPAGAIEALRGIDGDPRRFSAAAMAGATPAVVASAIALQELRFFLRTSGDLLLEPFGSFRMFHAAAAFDSAGLGPYFGNVPRIVRRSADLFELAAIAEEAAAAIGATIGEEAWIILLSRHLEGGLRTEVIDDLGDRNAAFALQIILERALAWPAAEIDQPLVMRIRDAALDNLDYELAGIAQRALVGLKPTDMLERRILGSIDASAGRVAAADQNLSVCLVGNPEDKVLRAEIEANQARRYLPFALAKGFGSPVDRQLERLRRRMLRATEGSQAGTTIR